MIKSIALIADTYAPAQTSAALQLNDLVCQFVEQGINVTVIVPDSQIQSPSLFEVDRKVGVLRLKTAKHKKIGNIRRAIAEFLMPFYMVVNLQKSTFRKSQWDAIIWYSPSIFFGPLVWYLKKKNPCPSYLILRDIFPAWALDLGLIRKNSAYYFFKFFENFQYSQADFIGVQTNGNLDYFNSWSNRDRAKVEVLHNWLSPKPLKFCSISIASLPITNRKIFVYAGNMGVAQGMDDLLSLAKALLHRKDIGFLFVGQGSGMKALRDSAKRNGLENICFCDEINADEIPGLYAQCHVGLISLDPRHKTHNIPGKFLSYLHEGLPVLAIVNKGNDILEIIDTYQVGRGMVDRNPTNLAMVAESLIEDVSCNRHEISDRCKKLASTLFSSNTAVDQILSRLNSLK